MQKGTTLSEGYAIGKLVFVREETELLPKGTFLGPEEEKRRLHQAIQESVEYLQSLVEELRKTVGMKEADILMGHVQICRDPVIISEAEELIEKRSFTAEEAVERVGRRYMKLFGAYGDTLLKERVSDIKSVAGLLLRNLLQLQPDTLPQTEERCILVAKEFTPAILGQCLTKSVVGLIAEEGGVVSHSAILARTMGIPFLVGIKKEDLTEGEGAILDGIRSLVYLRPSQGQVEQYLEKKRKFLKRREELFSYVSLPTVTRNGEQRKIYANIGHPEEVTAALCNGAEGIGLFRTELFFMNRPLPPTEEEQYRAFRYVVDAMEGKEVVFRTLDLAADKTLPYVSSTSRGSALYAEYPRIIVPHLKALLRAGSKGNVKIMFPMVSTVEELKMLKLLVTRCRQDLEREGRNVKDVPLGIMVETSGALEHIGALAKEADFFSIGTNDLSADITGVPRTAGYADGEQPYLNPDVWVAVKNIIFAARLAGIPVSMCGEAAADLRLTELLLNRGLDIFSVAPTSILPLRKKIRELEGPLS